MFRLPGKAYIPKDDIGPLFPIIIPKPFLTATRSQPLNHFFHCLRAELFVAVIP